MPLPAAGEKVLGNMQKEYGSEKGKRVFYASINKGKPGSEKWDPGRKARARRSMSGGR